MTNAIDLSQLNEIEFVPLLSIDDITDSIITWLLEWDGLELSGPEDPAYRIIRSLAYRERLWRQNANESCRNVTLAYSQGNALDHIGITYHRTVRLPNESDDDYRARITLAPEGTSVAGPQNSYIFHGLSASPDVKDIDAEGPEIDVASGSLESTNDVEAGQVRITVLSREGNGTPTPELLDTVNTALNDKWVRPLCDSVVVQAASVINYEINAVLFIKNLAEPSEIINIAKLLAERYVTAEHRLGGRVARSGVDQALHRPGVSKVVLDNWQDIEASRHEAPYCTAINITYERLA